MKFAACACLVLLAVGVSATEVEAAGISDGAPVGGRRSLSDDYDYDCEDWTYSYSSGYR